MKQAQIRLPDDAAMRAYIDGSEHAFEERLRTVCRTAAAGGRRILTLAGPSCSGKTTTAEMLKLEFAAIGKHLHTISIDDFYYDHDVLAARSRARGGEIDYDSPETALCRRCPRDHKRAGRLRAALQLPRGAAHRYAADRLHAERCVPV